MNSPLLGIMKIITTRIALITGLIILGIGAYRFHQEWLNAQNVNNATLATKFDIENARLRKIVEAELEKIPLPAESSLIYQETEASRICKTSAIKRLYVNELSPADVCKTIYFPLKEKGWKSYSGCSAPFDQHKRASSNENSYTHLAAGAPSRKFGLSVAASPKDSWAGSSFISLFAREKALPIAKREGKPYFILVINYIEDHALFNQKCPENQLRCDCVNKSLFAWKFTNGQEFFRSD